MTITKDELEASEAYQEMAVDAWRGVAMTFEQLYKAMYESLGNPTLGQGAAEPTTLKYPTTCPCGMLAAGCEYHGGMRK